MTSIREELTSKEKEILALLISGDSWQEISTRLFISQKIVARIYKRLLKKMGDNNIERLVIYGLERNLELS